MFSSNSHKLQDFLKKAHLYRLGELLTESLHPKTLNLSQCLHQRELKTALRALVEVDTDALPVTLKHQEQLLELTQEIANTLQTGGKIYLCGCGATGRLSLLLESLWRQQCSLIQKQEWSERVISFMAGGDVALIRSIENFEDHPEYGARQLRELGMGPNDLLLASSEGGETPFVIGATWEALTLSKRKPYFLYCNPDSLLVSLVERSRKVIEHSEIKKVSLVTGPMAISGSTRMQASSVLMHFLGLALLGVLKSALGVQESVEKILDIIQSEDIFTLVPLIEQEYAIYNQGEYVLYCPQDWASMGVLTDTTERSPTFALTPFENVHVPEEDMGLCYMCLDDAPNTQEAWKQLLKRHPRVLNWPGLENVAGSRRLYGFDFSKQIRTHRQLRSAGKKHHDFSISAQGGHLVLTLGPQLFRLSLKGLGALERQMLLKIVLNTHSTLLMGLMGRYEGNMMTWVKPSNGKLIDRACRYIDVLLQREGIKLEKEDILAECFTQMEFLKHNESIVLKTREALKMRALKAGTIS